MNTNPDETKLALWLDDELHGDELAAFDAGAGSDPVHIAARDQIRKLKALLQHNLPASQEPPFREFFNQRVGRAIRQPAPAVIPLRRQPAWRTLAVPLAACAGMAFTFWLGSQTRQLPPPPQVVETPAPPRAIPVEAFVYTPETGVSVERYASADDSATIIVLDGLAAIPDTLEFSTQSSWHGLREADSTAAIENPAGDTLSL